MVIAWTFNVLIHSILVIHFNSQDAPVSVYSACKAAHISFSAGLCWLTNDDQAFSILRGNSSVAAATQHYKNKTLYKTYSMLCVQLVEIHIHEFIRLTFSILAPWMYTGLTVDFSHFWKSVIGQLSSFYWTKGSFIVPTLKSSVSLLCSHSWLVMLPSIAVSSESFWMWQPCLSFKQSAVYKVKISFRFIDPPQSSLQCPWVVKDG